MKRMPQRSRSWVYSFIIGVVFVVWAVYSLGSPVFAVLAAVIGLANIGRGIWTLVNNRRADALIVADLGAEDAPDTL